MKKLVVVLIYLFPLISYTQIDSICGIMPKKDGQVYYSEVIECENVTAAELYSNAKIWIANTFVDAKSVTAADVENTSLVIKWKTEVSFTETIRSEIILVFKDGRYKYELTNVYAELSAPSINMAMDVTFYSWYGKCDDAEKYNMILYFDDKFTKLINSMNDKIKTLSDW